MELFEKLTSKAHANRQRIVLPEGLEPRTLTAADRIIEEELADIILIGHESEIKELAAQLKLKNIDKAQIVDPSDENVIDKYAPLFFELRKKKGISMEEARLTTANPLYLGCRRTSSRCDEHYRKRSPRSIPSNQDTTRHKRCFGSLRDASQ